MEAHCTTTASMSSLNYTCSKSNIFKFLVCFEFTTELGTYHKILNIHLYALDLHLWKDRCKCNQDFFVCWGGGGDSGVGGGVTGYWCILVTNWRRRSITILCRILVRFFFSSKWAEFLHVVFDLIENRSTVFFRRFVFCFRVKSYAKNQAALFEICCWNRLFSRTMIMHTHNPTEKLIFNTLHWECMHVTPV